MKRKLESLKLEFAKGLQISDYQLVYDYSKIEDCLLVIKMRDLLPSKTKFKVFRFKGTEPLLLQANNCFLIEYAIIQTEDRFELYEMTLSTYNKFENKVNETF